MLTINDIDRYQPVYVLGKRPKNRPFLDVQTLEIISRREHIKRTAGETPEQKALRRYREGKAPAGKTVQKQMKKEEKSKKKENGKTKKEDAEGYQEDLIITKYQPHGDIDRGMVQLAGTYRFMDMQTGDIVAAGGFSRAYAHRSLIIQRPEAVNFAIKRLREDVGGGSSRYEWLGPEKGIIEEVWLRF